MVAVADQRARERLERIALDGAQLPHANARGVERGLRGGDPSLGIDVRAMGLLQSSHAALHETRVDRGGGDQHGGAALQPHSGTCLLRPGCHGPPCRGRRVAPRYQRGLVAPSHRGPRIAGPYFARRTAVAGSETAPDGRRTAVAGAESAQTACSTTLAGSDSSSGTRSTTVTGCETRSGACCTAVARSETRERAGRDAGPLPRGLGINTSRASCGSPARLASLRARHDAVPTMDARHLAG
jgi:hypothetical protein